MSLPGVVAALIVLSFGASTFLTGLFAAYFGAGTSRKIGLALTLVGLVSLGFFASATWHILPGFDYSVWQPEDALLGLAGVVGGTIGTTVALVLFFVAILKA